MAKPILNGHLDPHKPDPLKGEQKPIAMVHSKQVLRRSFKLFLYERVTFSASQKEKEKNCQEDWKWTCFEIWR